MAGRIEFNSVAIRKALESMTTAQRTKLQKDINTVIRRTGKVNVVIREGKLKVASK